MESSLFSKEKINHCKKKVIPWHVQKRYMESLSQLSLNQTIATAFYKKEIKSLKRNNKHLALALQRSRYLATEKENLLIDNGKILDIINFSKLKLMDMAVHMKQATACLDETLLLLNSAITDNLSKRSPNNLSYRNDFKNKLQELKIEPIKEAIEVASRNLDGSNKNAESVVRKGKISRVDGCITSPNKKCKLGKKGGKIKEICKNGPQFVEKASAAASNTVSKDTSVKNSKKCDSALNIKSQRKKSLPKKSNIKSPSSFKLPSTSSKLSHQAKNKQKCQDKKCKDVKVMLADIADSFVLLKANNDHSYKINGPNSTDSSNFNGCPQNFAEDDILIKKCISESPVTSEITSRPNNLASNSYSSQLASTVNNAEIPNSSENSSNSSNLTPKNLACSDIPGDKEMLPALPFEENGDFASGRTIPVVKMHQIEEGDANHKQKAETCIELEKNKKSYKSYSPIGTKRVHFYFDEDSIEENMDGETTTSKNKGRKCINKCKARKTVSNIKKNSPSKNTVLKSNFMLDDNVSKLGKNSYLVTAEVHSPPNGIFVQEMKSKMRVSEKMEPCVVLTDIFKSNQDLLSEMVGNGLQENRCLQKTQKIAAEAPLTPFTVNDLNSAEMDIENNAENRCMRTEDREIIEERGQRRRAKIASYKEPSLNVKMRRLF